MKKTTTKNRKQYSGFVAGGRASGERGTPPSWYCHFKCRKVFVVRKLQFVANSFFYFAENLRQNKNFEHICRTFVAVCRNFQCQSQNGNFLPCPIFNLWRRWEKELRREKMYMATSPQISFYEVAHTGYNACMY